MQMAMILNVDVLLLFPFQYSGIRIGPVVKKDVMRASAMLEHDSKYVIMTIFIAFVMSWFANVRHIVPSRTDSR